MARPGLHKHPKFKRLVKLLNVPAPHARGYLECLWEVSYEAGNPIIGDDLDVSLACEYPGDPSDIVAALSQCGGESKAGFIEQNDDGLWIIHDLFDHAPEYVASRAECERERSKDKVCEECKGIYRSRDKRSQYCSSRCRTMHWRKKGDDSVTDCDRSVRHSDGLLQSVTECDGSPAPAPAPAPAPIRADSSEPEAGSEPSAPAEYPEFETVGRQKRWMLSPATVAEWSSTFPGVNVDTECRRAWSWLNANPTKRKTHKGMSRFLFSWLSRAQDSSGRAPPSSPIASHQQRREELIETLMNRK